MQKRCWLFVQDNFRSRCGCFFKLQSAFTDGVGECWRCGGSHKISPLCFCVDLLFDSGPCQPFSVYRNRRGHTDRTGSVANHPDLETTVFEWLAVVEKLKPKGGIKENVPAIASPCADCPDECESWSAYIIKKLNSWGYAVWVVRLDNAWFIDSPRKRWFLVYLSDALGGRHAIMWMRRRLQD